MKAFNNDLKLKQDLLTEVIKHREADMIIKGKYGKLDEGFSFKGCAVGCSLRSYALIEEIELDVSEHKNYELFGIPELLARLEDEIFEGLSKDLALTWPERFLAAINVGSDLSTVWPKFAQWLLTDETYGVIKYAKTDEQRAVIQKVSDLYRDGKTIDEFKLAAADTATACATHATAYAVRAADAAATYAHTAAAHAADAHATYAHTAYAHAAAAHAAAAKRREVREAQSEYLLKLLRECE